MPLRMTKQEIEKLGDRARQAVTKAQKAQRATTAKEGRKKAEAATPRKTAIDNAATGQKSAVKTIRGRLPRIRYELPGVLIELSLTPRPKERARTFIDEKAILRVYARSQGQAGRFIAILKGKVEDESGGVMRTVTPEETKRYEELVALFASRAMAAAGLARYECPVELFVQYRFPGDPDTWPTATSQGDGDLDNLDKAIFDGMNRVVYRDDAVVVRRTGIKICAVTPGITVVVRPADPNIEPIPFIEATARVLREPQAEILLLPVAKPTLHSEAMPEILNHIPQGTFIRVNPDNEFRAGEDGMVVALPDQANTLNLIFCYDRDGVLNRNPSEGVETWLRSDLDLESAELPSTAAGVVRPR